MGKAGAWGIHDGTVGVRASIDAESFLMGCGIVPGATTYDGREIAAADAGWAGAVAAWREALRDGATLDFGEDAEVTTSLAHRGMVEGCLDEAADAGRLRLSRWEGGRIAFFSDVVLAFSDESNGCSRCSPVKLAAKGDERMGLRALARATGNPFADPHSLRVGTMRVSVDIAPFASIALDAGRVLGVPVGATRMTSTPGFAVDHYERTARFDFLGDDGTGGTNGDVVFDPDELLDEVLGFIEGTVPMRKAEACEMRGLRCAGVHGSWGRDEGCRMEDIDYPAEPIETIGIDGGPCAVLAAVGRHRPERRRAEARERLLAWLRGAGAPDDLVGRIEAE